MAFGEGPFMDIPVFQICIKGGSLKISKSLVGEKLSRNLDFVMDKEGERRGKF